MNNGFENSAEQAAAFQKWWMESASRMIQATLNVSPNGQPEMLNQLRTGMFQALAKSWEDFMRSPQFLEGMKQWMEQAVAFRKMSSDLMAKLRNEMQAPSRDDVDTIMLAVRHLETRVLDRLDAMSAEIEALKAQPKSAARASRGAASRGQQPPAGQKKEAA